MPRGGRRQGAGRKNQWESGCSFSETTVIRVPKSLKDEILDLAHRLDAGEVIELDTKSIKERNDYLENKVLELEQELNQLLKQKRKENEIVTNSKTLFKIKQLDLDTKSKINISGSKLSEKRFNLNRASAAKYKQKNSMEKFAEWSQLRDPDDIAWIPLEKGYTPRDELSSELLNKLRDWIAENP